MSDEVVVVVIHLLIAANFSCMVMTVLFTVYILFNRQILICVLIALTMGNSTRVCLQQISYLWSLLRLTG